MELLSWIKKRFSKKSEIKVIGEMLFNRAALHGVIEVTPEFLGDCLLSIMGSHLRGLGEENLSFKKGGIQLDESKITPIIQELFTFYYSLLTMVMMDSPHRKMTIEEMKIYGGAFLLSARHALMETEIPYQYKEWVLHDDSFNDIFDSGFGFYFHNQIPENEMEPLQRVMRLCECEEDNLLLYMIVKLQYRLCNILNVQIDTDFWYSFCPLYIYQTETVFSYVKMLKNDIFSRNWGN